MITINVNNNNISNNGNNNNYKNKKTTEIKQKRPADCRTNAMNYNA